MGPIIGLIIQIILIGMLASIVGLGVTGWVTGLGYGIVTCAILTRAMGRSGMATFGPADWVTLGRAALIGGVAVLTADSFHRPAPVVALVAVTIVALLLDALDGQVARRTGTVSEFGARFDMEVDAVLILVLSVYVAQSMGWWVLALGVMRFAFVAAGRAWPWMRRQLPPRYWRKVVAATQGVVLVVATAGVLPDPLIVTGFVVTLIMLVESFGRDMLWLWLRRAEPLPS